MNILPAILHRRSVRRFSEKSVDREIILTCLDAARLAPSAENSQPWRFLVLDDPDLNQRFGQAAFSGVYKYTRWAVKAPVILAVCADLDFMANQLGRLFTGIPFYLLDVGMAGEHFALQAAEMGLGTCWIGWFHMKKARKALKLPRHIRLCALMAVGYPADDWVLKPHKRRKPEDIVRWNRWK
ncbi:nitroreductase family protein [bacterium]|nr:nitroreductase family protein [bacterium]